MRIWTLHPRYLDAKGLVALWREALLAQKVLQGATKGYRNHPQLKRFKAQADPPAAIAGYLRGVYEEAQRRGYRFDQARIGDRGQPTQMTVTSGQIAYEWGHLKRKLRQRDPRRYQELAGLTAIEAHPSFRVVAGAVEGWEINQDGA